MAKCTICGKRWDKKEAVIPLLTIAEMYSKHYQASKMNFFAKRPIIMFGRFLNTPLNWICNWGTWHSIVLTTKTLLLEQERNSTIFLYEKKTLEVSTKILVKSNDQHKLFSDKPFKNSNFNLHNNVNILPQASRCSKIESIECLIL